MNLNEIEVLAKKFLEKVFEQLAQNKILLEKHWSIDHLCYRTATQDDYLNIKRQFESFSKLLIESEVNGRFISTFKLPYPIIFNEWEIDLIEIPAPKYGKQEINGFEHIEIVCDLTFAEIKNRYSQCHFKESGLEKSINAELEISFADLTVKFHHLSLESVINIESNPYVFSALKSSRILNYLKPFSPLIAGTLPLNLSVVESDVDIIISGDDLQIMKSQLINKFECYPDFICDEKLVHGERTILASFTFQEIKFEIFGQQTFSLKQKGYLHFLVEERLIKIGGEPFLNKINEARSLGLRTEPAFAKVLQLSGDPYEELLSLNKKSNQELKTLIQSP